MRTISALLLFAAGAGPVPEVTAVRGPSWIQHLGVELDDTHMGKMGGQGPPPATRREPMPSLEGRESSLQGFIHRFFSFLDARSI
jgi:hypothetical protein